MSMSILRSITGPLSQFSMSYDRYPHYPAALPDCSGALGDQLMCFLVYTRPPQ